MVDCMHNLFKKYLQISQNDGKWTKDEWTIL